MRDYDVHEAAKAPCGRCGGRGAVPTAVLELAVCDECEGSGIDSDYRMACRMVENYLDALGGPNYGHHFEENEETLARTIAAELGRRGGRDG